jgi:glycosyltransferase involved in cell wall biosynthesis
MSSRPDIASVAIEASALTSPVRTGVQVYTENLLRELLSRPDEVDVRIFFKQRPFKGAVRALNEFPNARRYFDPSIAMIGDARITHSTDNKFLYKRKCANIATIHDVAIFLPENDIDGYTTPQFRSRQYHVYRRMLERADRVIAVSESTKTDISRVFQTDPRRVVVAYPGISTFPPAEPASDDGFLNRFGLAKAQYLLFVGAVSIRKNLLGLVEAFSRLAPKHGLKLVVAGPRSMGHERIIDRVASLNLSNSVVFTSYTSDMGLSALYRNARAFVFPTFYEGFGLPILEAMSFGLPVLIGNRGSAPEISGGLAVEADPSSVDDIVSGLEKVIAGGHDPSDLKCHASKFRWDRCGEKICAIYRELVD